MGYRFARDISGCGLSGVINIQGKKISGEDVVRSIVLQTDRGNGLGAGFAAYGIYSDYSDYYAFHVMYDDQHAKEETETLLERLTDVTYYEEIPTQPTENIKISPLLYRYFLKPLRERAPRELRLLGDDDIVVNIVMRINSSVEGAYVFSSGKNMGVFKGVGFPRDIAEFFRIEDYEAYIWTAHNRFPTNTPGWWGGAHPFTLLDWSIVHNGEISSYGINKRYLEMYGYKLTLLTDTEVVAYILDLLIRKNGFDVKSACTALAAPFWKDIDIQQNGNALRAIRMVYGSALLNGPFAILFAFSDGLVGLNDRVKLRPLVVGVKGDFVYMASEEAAIREICPDPDRVWAPKAGDPVIVKIGKGIEN
jgi:glutamate synthase domain-containing protein 1